MTIECSFNARRIVGVLAVMGMMMHLSACDFLQSSEEGKSEKDAEDVEEAVPVKVRGATSETITESIEATTTLSPKISVRMVAEVAGTISDWRFEVGDKVSQGEVLAVVNIPELDIQMREARLQLNRAKREVRSLQSLHKKGYVSDQVWEEAESQQEIAQTSLARLQEQAERQNLTSPIDGTVLERAIERGESVSVGTLMYRVAALDVLVADISIPERALSDIQKGASAMLEIPAVGEGPITGVVERISPEVDESTGTVDVRIRITDAGEARLRPGMFATVRIVTDRKENALVIPARAVIEAGDNPSVFVAYEESGTYFVRRTPVVLGLRDGEKQEITDGLEEGTTVVVVGQSRLRDGAEVRLVDRGDD